MSRSRGPQKGYLFRKGPSWFGRFTTYHRGRPKQTCEYLGRVAELSEDQARNALSVILKREYERTPLWSKLGAVSAPMLQPDDSRLSERPKHLGRGIAAELLVCADLLRKGLHPYRAVDPQAACDLILYDDGRYQRLEVKAVTPRWRGVILCDTRRNFGKFDLIAFVFPDGRIIYKAAEELTDPKYPFGRAPFDPGQHTEEHSLQSLQLSRNSVPVSHGAASA